MSKLNQTKRNVTEPNCQN